MYCAFAAVAIYLGYRYRRELKEGWDKLVADLKRLWDRLFGKRGTDRTPEQLPENEVAELPRYPTFSDFQNPFATRQGMASPEVIRYSFQAVEAWARDRGYPRDPQATPHEFVLALGGSIADNRIITSFVGTLPIHCPIRYWATTFRIMSTGQTTLMT